jgi:hypothetical protein
LDIFLRGHTLMLMLKMSQRNVSIESSPE